MTKTQSKLRPLFENPGQKFYVSQWIIEQLPPDHQELDYIEPFAGAAGVYLNKPKSNRIEVINDSDLGIIQVFRALRDEPNQFISRIAHTKYCENTYNKSIKKTEFEDYLDHAVNEFICRKMSQKGLKKKFSMSRQLIDKVSKDVHAWKLNGVSLTAISERVQDVYLLNLPAQQVIKTFDEKESLFYIDPPPPPTDIKNKQCEMSVEDHIDLATLLKTCKAKVLISGENTSFYKKLYKSWRSVKSKDEIVWMNY